MSNNSSDVPPENLTAALRQHLADLATIRQQMALASDVAARALVDLRPAVEIARLTPRIDPSYFAAMIPPIPPAFSQDFINQLEGMKNLVSKLMPPRSVFAQIANLENIWRRGLADLWPAFERWKRDQAEVVQVLTSQGWWPHPKWPVNVMYEVLRLKKQKKVQLLDKIICDTYEANGFRLMSEAMAEWDAVPEYRARKAVFRAGMRAFRRKDYISAVAVWLPQVEGVLRGLAERQGYNPNSWKRFSWKKQKDDEVEREIVGAVADSFFKLFRALYDSPNLNAGSRPRKRDFPLRRDLVLHGVDLRFGRRANAMRIFLMLDTLHYFIVQYEQVSEAA